MEQRNMFLAFALSIAVLVGWSYIFPSPNTEVKTGVETSTQALKQEQVTASEHTPAPELRPMGVDVSSVESIPNPLEEKSKKVFYLANNLLRLGMDDRGWLTEGELLNYTESIEPDSDYIHILSTGKGHNVYVNSGVLGHQRATPFVLNNALSDRQHKVFTATLKSGVVWQRTLSLKPDSYIIHVEDRIIKGAGLKMFRQVVERNPDKTKDTFYEHMGATGLLSSVLQEPSYDDLDETPVKMSATGGWTGIMDRYFLTALVSQQNVGYRYYYKGDGRSYQAGVLDDGVLDQGDALFVSDIYMGPKSIAVMKPLNLGLERSVDFGIFSFIAKPMHHFMMWIDGFVHNFGWSIILLVVCIKLILFYPSHKAYVSMAGMRKIQPDMVRLKELYGEDRQKMGQEMMKLYKKNKVNPLGGCLPILIQIPIFFSLYKVLLMSIEMRQAPFIGWIHDLSVQDPYFILPVVMGISMYIQQKLNPQPTDPMQAKIMQFLPPVFTVMFLFFPAGLVLYWVINNTLTILQQYYVMKKLKAI
ncbi:MAG: membrane protein insertase YidC [Zetaproteobacteria bacterium]|nr:membrane protein insertase YidC [Zetaproteobacteria bacterium]